MKEQITAAELRDALEGVESDRPVYLISQGAIDDGVSVEVTSITWNNGKQEDVVRIEGR